MNLKIDLANPAHIRAVTAFFNELNSIEEANKGVLIQGENLTTAKAPAAKAPAPKTTTPKTTTPKTTTPKTTTPKTATPKTATRELKPAAEEGAITRDDLREVLTKVIKKDPAKQADIVQKIKDLGANNITGLEETRFEEFHTFLESLEGDDLPY